MSGSKMGITFCHSGPRVVPFYPFLGEGSPTKIGYRKKKGTLFLTCLLEDLDSLTSKSCSFRWSTRDWVLSEVFSHTKTQEKTSLYQSTLG